MNSYEINTEGCSKDYINTLKYHLSYLGELILKVEEKDQSIIVKYDASFENNAVSAINNVIQDLDSRLKNIKAETIFENIEENTIHSNIIEELIALGDICIYDEGLVGFGGKFLNLYRDLDSMFLDWAMDLGAKEFQYPDLISLDTLAQYNYLSQFPQHLIFAPHLKEDREIISNFSKEIRNSKKPISADFIDIDRLNYANKLAVCPHVYKQYEGKVLTTQPIIITSVGKCKRYESINVNRFERLLDFTMREIVVIGVPEFILEIREILIEKTKEFLKQMKLSANIKSATDPFFTTEYSASMLLQQKFKLKYELNLYLPDSNELSVGSFNYHGSHFIDAFGIKSESNVDLATGCIAFGLERFAYAIMTQKGLLEDYGI